MSNTEQHKQFSTIANTVAFNLSQLLSANAVFFQLIASYATFRLNDAQNILCETDGCTLVYYKMRSISQESLESLKANQARNTLITVVTLLDTYLTDITRFLVLTRPESISKDRLVSFQDILGRESLSSIIDLVVNKVVHEQSYANFRTRVGHLQKTFGISLDQLSDKIDEFENVIQVRNRLIHDVAQYEYTSGSTRGQIVLSQKTSKESVSWVQATKAIDVGMYIAKEIYEKTSRHFFKQEPNAFTLEALTFDSNSFPVVNP